MRIGVTQRVEVVRSYGERRDCLDQAWTRLLGSVGLQLVPVPNCLDDVAAWAIAQRLTGVILTGGNDLADLTSARNSAPERDATERRMLDWARHENLPVLGVCRGILMLNVYFGGSVVPVNGHVACMHSLFAPDGGLVPFDYERVNSFHAWGITGAGLGPGLRPLAMAEDDTIEAFCHETLPWVGIMWHPERDNEHAGGADHRLLRDVFLNHCRGF